jgi:hypothetical protein
MNDQQNSEMSAHSHAHSHPQRGFFDGNPKMLFVFGLVTGIAATLVFGNLTGLT